MKIINLFIISLLLGTSLCRAQATFVTSDIDHFWIAYDKITGTKDSAAQYQYINELFLQKGTPGLRAIMDARRYTAASYINAINNYPLFWKSIRANTLKAPAMATEIKAGVSKLKQLYPQMRPATVYFTIGAFRTPGTIVDNMVLIGSEMAMADKSIVTSEFGSNMDNVKTYFASDPISNIVFLNVHEFVHTQQKEYPYILLHVSVAEGIAEFLAAKTMGDKAVTPAIKYGKEHERAVKEKFMKVMFSPHTVNSWLYNNTNNEFGTRDLGYYIGYAIAEKFYAAAKNKQQAIKEMIELDFEKDAALFSYVDRSGYFPKTLRELKKKYEDSRPVVQGQRQFLNGDKHVDAGITEITIYFSQPMDTLYRNFDYGPGGEATLMRISRFVGFSADGKSATFETALKPGKEYELLIGEGFRNKEGIGMKPYLLSFKTD